MADPWGAIMEAIGSNWQIIAILILGATTFLPWIGLFLLNFFNNNIWQEITSVFDRTRVKLFRIQQNGTGAVLYRKMRPDRQIVLKEDKKTGHHELILPSTPPIQDFKSHRQFFISVEGVEGTRDVLRETNYDVNTPMKAMGHTMSFEAGREFERTYNPQGGLFSLMNILQIGVPLIFLILILILIFTQIQTLGEITKALSSNTAMLELISKKLETSILVGGSNAVIVP